VRLLELLTPELTSPSDVVWDSLATLDTYRRRFPSAPPELTNTILIGSLLVPMGALGAPPSDPDARDRVSFGMLAVAKRDLERLRHLLLIVPKLSDPRLPPKVVRGLAHRPSFPDALIWAEVFTDTPADLLEHWRHARQHRQVEPADTAAGHAHGHAPGQPQGEHVPGVRKRRRRRRRRGRGGPPAA
jgi:hypothetical protein